MLAVRQAGMENSGLLYIAWCMVFGSILTARSTVCTHLSLLLAFRHDILKLKQLNLYERMWTFLAT